MLQAVFVGKDVFWEVESEIDISVDMTDNCALHGSISPGAELCRKQ